MHNGSRRNAWRRRAMMKTRRLPHAPRRTHLAGPGFLAYGTLGRARTDSAEAPVQISQLPYIDEHATAIAADVDEVWAVLVETVDRAFSGAGTALYTRAVGCADSTSSGPRPLAEGSTVPGFRVATAVPGSELVLEGRHWFSSYALIFRLDQLGAGRSRLRAESRGVFPGVAGRIYRLLVVGTGGHVLAVRHLLSGIKRRSEPSARSRR
jgi:hypothetical protein